MYGRSTSLQAPVESGDSRGYEEFAANQFERTPPRRRGVAEPALVRREWSRAVSHDSSSNGMGIPWYLVTRTPDLGSITNTAWGVGLVSGASGRVALERVATRNESLIEQADSPARFQTASSAQTEGFWPIVNWTWRSDDVFKDPVVPDENVLASASMSEWMFLLVALGLLLILDGILLRRLEGVSGHIVMVLFWVSIALVYCAHYCVEFGAKAGADWFLGYLLEVILSIDNVFVFHLVFESFRPPVEQQHKAMYFGVIGAFVARLVLFLALGTVVHTVRWVRLLMGLVLIYSGIKVTVQEEVEEDPANNSVVRWLRSCLGSRLTPRYDFGGRMFVFGDDGRLNVTLLLPLIVCVEVVDVVFAMDSLSAKVAQIKNQYAAYSSSAFAILALRALFFLVRDLVAYFQHVKYGLCIILVFIGLELLVADFVELPSSALCLSISAVFLISILSSIRSKWDEDSNVGSRRSSRRWSTADVLAAEGISQQENHRRQSRDMSVQTMDQDTEPHGEGAEGMRGPESLACSSAADIGIVGDAGGTGEPSASTGAL